MDSSDRAKIPAYLLGKLSEAERHGFETRMLEDGDLLAAVKTVERDFLRVTPTARSRPRAYAGCFLAGAASGAVLTELLHRLLA